MFVFAVFMVRIFPHLDRIRRDTLYLSVFSPNVGKYGSEKFQIQTLFTQCLYEKKWYETKWLSILAPFAKTIIFSGKDMGKDDPRC